WLDESSAVVLGFAARRLRDANIGYLATRRLESDKPLVLPEPTTVLRVPPLSLGAVQRLVADRAQTLLPREAARRRWEISGGNPLYALELAHAAVQRGGRLSLGETPIPTDLVVLLRERLAELPPETRETLLVAALLPSPSLELLDAVDEPGAWRRLRSAL